MIIDQRVWIVEIVKWVPFSLSDIIGKASMRVYPFDEFRANIN